LQELQFFYLSAVLLSHFYTTDLDDKKPMNNPGVQKRIISIGRNPLSPLFMLEVKNFFVKKHI